LKTEADDPLLGHPRLPCQVSHETRCRVSGETDGTLAFIF